MIQNEFGVKNQEIFGDQKKTDDLRAGTGATTHHSWPETTSRSRSESGKKLLRFVRKNRKFV